MKLKGLNYSKQQDTDEMTMAFEEILEISRKIQPDPNGGSDLPPYTGSVDPTKELPNPAQEQSLQSATKQFLPDAHAQIKLMLDAWQQKNYGKLNRLAIEFATETEHLGIPLLPAYSRALAGFAEQNNNDEIHATFLQFCKWAEKVETGKLEQLISAGTFPVLALPMPGSPTANLH